MLRTNLVERIFQSFKMDSVQLVTITHYIDPSRFYCRNLATADDDRQKVADLEEKLKTFASGNKTDFVDSADELKIGAVSY